MRKSRYGGLPIMCLRFNPIEKGILLGAGSEGMVVACNLEDQSCTDFIRGKQKTARLATWKISHVQVSKKVKDSQVQYSIRHLI